MLSKLTHGTSRASIIFLATVVLPDALPPHTPVKMQVNPLPHNAAFWRTKDI